MPSADQDFLLYPIDTGQDPVCPRCGQVMLLAECEAREGKPDLLTFRCGRCGATDKFICEPL